LRRGNFFVDMVLGDLALLHGKESPDEFLVI
jgi:hypothetical protein